MIKIILVILLLSNIHFINSEKVKKAMVLGFDGVDPVTFQRLLDDGLLPNFKKLYLQNSYGGGVEGTPDEQWLKSGPGWMTILTGTWVNRHHIFENEVLRVPDTPTIMRLLKEYNPNLKVYAYAGWLSLYTEVLRKEKDILEKTGWGPADFQVEMYINSALKKGNPDFIFAQFDNIDDAGHEYCHGTIYDASVIMADTLLGRIMKGVEEREKKYPNEDWLILTTTDHGRDAEGCGHGQIPQVYTEKHIFIGTNKADLNSEFTRKLETNNDNFDGLYSYPNQATITPTVLAYMGVPYNPEYKFQTIPLYGKVGLQKLMKKDEKLKWSYDPNDGSEQTAVYVYSNNKLIEIVDIRQEEWPRSEKGLNAWINGTEFTFVRDGVPVTFVNSYYEPEDVVENEEDDLSFFNIIKLMTLG